MSSNLETEISDGDKAKVVGTIEHAGTLVEQVVCSSATALKNQLLRCNREGRRVFPGRPLNLPLNPAQRVDYSLTLDGADKIIEHSRPDQVISVEAGISITSLQTLLAQYKQWFPVCLPDENISLMEYINSGGCGPLEQGYGKARDLVLGMQVVLGTGELIKCGGKVVKNVTGYDMPKLFAGAHGTLCIPFSAHLRLYALPETASTIILQFKNADRAFQVSRLILRSGLPVSCLEIVDTEIFRLLDNDKMPASLASIAKDNFILCVQLHGTASVVAELENELCKIVGEKIAASREIVEAQIEQQLWKFLSQPSSFVQAEWLELCGQTRDIEQLLAEMKDNYNGGSRGDTIFAWTARPGRNKALLVLARTVREKLHKETADSSANSLARLISDLKNSSARRSCQITVACADSSYLWNVQDLPNDDLVLKELKHRLKHQYDPNMVLNPLVSL